MSLLYSILVFLALFLQSEACLVSERDTIPISERTCPCWWDLEGILKDENGNPFKCACCKENAVQCGYPLHEYCAKKWNVDKGCVKNHRDYVGNWRYTMSEIGHPCHFDPDRRDCAWCNKDGYQCAPNNGLPNNKNKEFKEGQYCEYWKNNFKNCGGESQDCRLRPNICHENAVCQDTGVSIERKKWNFHRCICKPGFIGNGIFCTDASKDLSNVLIPAKGDLTQKLSVEMHKSVAFDPAATPIIEVGMVTDLEEVTDTLKANDTCIASSTCAIETMSCGPQN